MNKDIFGKALLDYFEGNYTEDIITWTNISTEDQLPLSYLFRDFKDMPQLEKKALKLATGKTLDVGCGAGSHSVWLQKKGIDVTAIDSSLGAIKTSSKRGVLSAEHVELLNFNSSYFNTILLLMNGTGIFKELTQVKTYLNHLKALLHKDGQILIDSSDIKYMYDDNDLKTNPEANTRYYGELDYHISYKGITETPMKWLYLDFETLQEACLSVGLKCKRIIDGNHFDYLAQLTLR